MTNCASRRLPGRAMLLPLLVALLCPLVVPAQAQYSTKYGLEALNSNSSDSNLNSAFGYAALFSNTTGYLNTASGLQALYSNTTGSGNTASGVNVLYYNTTGSDNTASGFLALYSNTTGYDNTANGMYALYYNTTGYSNLALGYRAGENLTTGANNIVIGNVGFATDTKVIRIGAVGKQTATYIAGISGETVSAGVEVYVNAKGQLGTITSSRRFKNDINDMGRISEKLMNLRPVTFRYKDSAEKGPHPLQYGLIAEEVAKIYPNLVQYDKQGKPFTVYYHLLTPMLLNELQKEHRQTGALKRTFLTQKAEVTTLKSELASLKQEHAQEMKTLAKLSAFVQTAQARELQQQAALVQR
jgi:hypothetical protein